MGITITLIIVETKNSRKSCLKFGYREDMSNSTHSINSLYGLSEAKYFQSGALLYSRAMVMCDECWVQAPHHTSGWLSDWLAK